ncbi:MAG: hypothetical protein Q8S31_00985 [Alphaproteobacteria bacterium]|nr:hypothetical protein [Alphaproteobacteria bacterium]
MKRILLSTALLATSLFAAQTNAELAVKEGQFTVTPHAGIAPTSSKDARVTRTFTKTTPGQKVNFPASNQDVTDNTFVRRSYNAKSHNMPYTFGIDLGYAPMDNVEVFFGFDYTKASGKKQTSIRKNISTKNYTNAYSTGTKTTDLVSKYKQGNYASYGFHLGGRYFFDLDSKFSPFVGGKLGLTRHTHGKHKVKDTTSIRTVGTTLLGNSFDYTNPKTAKYSLPLYKNSIGFSAGLQAGFDLRVSEQVSLVAMAEAIASTGIKTNKKTNLVYRTQGAGNNYTVFSKVTRSPKTAFSFPLTAGVKVRM